MTNDQLRKNGEEITTEEGVLKLFGIIKLSKRLNLDQELACGALLFHSNIFLLLPVVEKG